MISYIDAFQLFTDGFNVFSEEARDNRLIEFFKATKPLYREMVFSKYATAHKLKPYIKPETIFSTADDVLHELEKNNKTK